MMLLLLFGGFLLNKERVPAYCRWLSGTSLFNYAYEVGALEGVHLCQRTAGRRVWAVVRLPLQDATALYQCLLAFCALRRFFQDPRTPLPYANGQRSLLYLQA